MKLKNFLLLIQGTRRRKMTRAKCWLSTIIGALEPIDNKKIEENIAAFYGDNAEDIAKFYKEICEAREKILTATFWYDMFKLMINGE